MKKRYYKDLYGIISILCVITLCITLIFGSIIGSILSKNWLIACFVIIILSFPSFVLLKKLIYKFNNYIEITDDGIYIIYKEDIQQIILWDNIYEIKYSWLIGRAYSNKSILIILEGDSVELNGRNDIFNLLKKYVPSKIRE